MAVSEYGRTQLFNWFEEHMGTERATTMMNLLPPVGWGDVATRRDLELLEERLDHKFDSLAGRLDGRIDSLAGRLDGRIDSLDGRIELLDGRIELLAGRLDGRIELVEARLGAMAETMSGLATKADVIESRYELHRTLVTWIFAAQATVVAAVGLLIAYLR